ncbi:MAG: hypothetical protein ACLVJN_09190 [Streptococcus parasanguinis]
MKNETKRFLAGSVAVLSLVVAGCSQSKSTSESAKETTRSKKRRTQAAIEYTTDNKIQQHHLTGMQKSHQ